MKRGFIINESLMDTISEATDKEFREIITKLYDYSTNAVVPEFGTKLGNTIFKLYKPFIDYNNEKYDMKCVNNGSFSKNVNSDRF